MKVGCTAPLITVGDNCLDVYVDKNQMAVGGNALNVAVQWRRQGLNARYFGAVGQDAEGVIMLEEINRAGLSSVDVERRPGSSAVTLIREQAGDRRFLLEDLGVGADYVPSEDRYAQLATAGWVHLGTHSSGDLVQRLIADGIPFSIDISTLHEGLALKGVQMIFASGPEDESQPVEPVLERLLAAGAKRVVLTCGKRGAFYSDGSETWSDPARAMTVVDTCGAGDSFIAQFISSCFLDRESPAPALRKATEAAALTCQHEGGFPQTLRPIPHWLPEKYADIILGTEGSLT